jgi:hypothetical protein
LPKITRPNFLYLIFGHSKVKPSKPRAKALGPNQNKNAQTQLVKLSKQKVFVKLKNLSDKKLGLVISMATVYEDVCGNCVGGVELTFV